MAALGLFVPKTRFVRSDLVSVVPMSFGRGAHGLGVIGQF